MKTTTTDISRKGPLHPLSNDLSAATGHLSSAYAKLSSLAKICDKETFRTILAASARPLVQVNIPGKFLNPTTEKRPVLEEEGYRNKLQQALLPQERNTALKGKQGTVQQDY